MVSNSITTKIKEKLKAKNPSLTSEELDKATKEIITDFNSDKRVDEDGHIIVAENVKIILSGAISNTTEVKD